MNNGLRELIRYISSENSRTGGVPSKEKLREEFPHLDIDECFADAEFQEILRRRYLDDFYSNDETLSMKQVAFIDMMCSSVDKRKPEQKLKDLGVSAARFQKWLDDPIFNKTLKERAEKAFEDRAPEVFNAIAESAISGDMSAAKFYMELSGRYSPKTNVNLNTNSGQVIELLIEVIQRHVNPDQLAAIAFEFESVLSGDLRPLQAPKALPSADAEEKHVGKYLSI